MPKDPNAAMQLAARVNGLASADMKPWHLKANYQTFDADGKPKDQGVFEEWWAGSEKWKVSFASPGFNQAHYRDGDSQWVTGDEGDLPARESMLRLYLDYPLPPGDLVAKEKFVSSNEKVGKVNLGCIKPAEKPVFERLTAEFPTVCLAKEIPAIRVEFYRDGAMVLFNKIAELNGRYIPEQIEIANSDLAIVKADVETLEGLSKIDDAEFARPVSARSLTPQVGGKVTAGDWVGGFRPEYPSMAKAANIDGTVVLWATITKTGMVSDVEVISGPQLLQRPALDAVKTWRYQPYMRNGQPVELRRRIDVVYRHGR